MRRKILSSAAATVVVAMGLTSHSQAAAIYLDVNNTVAGSGVVSAANVPWDTSTSSWNTDSAGVGTGTTTYVNDGSSDASFAAGTDGAVAYTMTVNGAISANSLTFDEGKVTFAGTATPSLSIGGGGVNVNVTTSTASASAPVFGATLPVTIAADQVWSTSSPGTTTVNGVVTFNGKLTLRRTPTLVNASNFAFANGASTGAGGVVIGQGAANPATLQIAANEVVTAGVLVSGPMGTGTVSLNGGRISSNAAANARTISNAVTLDATGSAIGGQSNVGALTFASTFTVNATADGGTVTFDAGASAAQALNFNGGTLLKGNITFNSAAQDTATFNGAISDDALITSVGKGFTKSGAGKLLLATSNTYSGGTTVSGGLLQVLAAGNLGAGNVSVTAGTFELDNPNSIANLAKLTVTAGTVNLAFTGTEQVAALTVGTTDFGPGTYTATDLGANFTGAGSILVAVPEPTSIGVILSGIPVLLYRHRRSNAKATA